jgi:molybdenum cofactor biosynthesis enzyme MoaA
VADLLKQDSAIETVTIALNYVCNSRCTFCFIERELDLGLPNTPDELIEKVFAENRAKRRYKRLILAGAEATLLPGLPDVARRALGHGGFEVVRLQTNGRRLADRAYLQTLIDAGIREYFVSIHAGTAALDARLTRNSKSFGEMRRGLRNVMDAGAVLISNTAVTRGNHESLDDLATLLLDEGVPESHFWAFIEFGDVGQAAEHVSHGDSVPRLLAAVSRLRAAGRRVVLSWFPLCLLGPHADLSKDHRDNTIIHDEFAARVARSGRFSCPHERTCPAFGTRCIGLHERHVEVIGDERGVLVPISPGQARLPG